jgi:hypothetical protein
VESHRLRLTTEKLELWLQRRRKLIKAEIKALT